MVGGAATVVPVGETGKWTFGWAKTSVVEIAVRTVVKTKIVLGYTDHLG